MFLNLSGPMWTSTGGGGGWGAMWTEGGQVFVDVISGRTLRPQADEICDTGYCAHKASTDLVQRLVITLPFTTTSTPADAAKNWFKISLQRSV